jgi:hypothetical protein
MKAKRLQECRALADAHPTNISAKIIVELCDEIDRLRMKGSGSNGSAPFNDGTPFPFGKYKGDPLCEVPDDYWNWWFNQNSDRGTIDLEAQFSPFPKKMVAIKKLKLHDYWKAHLALEKKNGA